jgi:CRISPR-associated endoribonuclease Cas6
MLASFDVVIKPEENAFLGMNTGKLMYAVFLKLIDEVDPDLAKRLHSPAGVKPFTVSPLNGELTRSGRYLVASRDGSYRFRFTALTKEAFTGLNKVLMGKIAPRNALNLEGDRFDILKVDMERSADTEWAGLSSYYELLDNAGDDLKITLAFSSPTAFRQGRVSLLFPLPMNVFYGYWRKWNAFSPKKIDKGFVDWLTANVLVESYQLETNAMSFKGFQQNGFIGTCRYVALDNDKERLHQLNALADFAFYCGTGAKTTMGMGQTRRIRNVRTVSG